MTEELSGVRKSWGRAAMETLKRAFDMGIFEFTGAALSFSTALATHSASFTKLGIALTMAGTFWAGKYAWDHRKGFKKPLGLSGPG